MRARVRLLVPEVKTTGALSNDDLDILLNAGALDVAMRTYCLITTATATVVASTQEYTLPSDCLKLLSVLYGGSGNWEKLEATTEDWLDRYINDWRNVTGTIYAYYRRGNDTIGLYKTPTSSEAGTDYLKYIYVEKPDSMTITTSDPFNNDTSLLPYHELVVLYAQSRIKSMLGKQGQADSIEANYLMKCREMKRNIGLEADNQQPIRPYYKGNSASSLKQNPLRQ